MSFRYLDQCQTARSGEQGQSFHFTGSHHPSWSMVGTKKTLQQDNSKLYTKSLIITGNICAYQRCFLSSTAIWKYVSKYNSLHYRNVRWLDHCSPCCLQQGNVIGEAVSSSGSCSVTKGTEYEHVNPRLERTRRAVLKLSYIPAVEVIVLASRGPSAGLSVACQISSGCHSYTGVGTVLRNWLSWLKKSEDPDNGNSLRSSNKYNFIGSVSDNTSKLQLRDSCVLCGQVQGEIFVTIS